MATHTGRYRDSQHSVQPTHSLFPFELVTHIASYLGDDKETLLACSLTCRVWRNATRPQTFQKVTIGKLPHLQAFCDLVKGERTIGSWIKKIRFTTSPIRLSSTQRVYPYKWVISAGEVLRGLETNLTKLSSITFDNVDICHDSDDYISVFEVLANFQTIQHVNVRMCSSSLTQFCNFLCKLPLLESVSIEGSGSFLQEGITPGTGLIKMSLLSLRASEWDQTNTRTWFTSGIRAASLQKLVVDVLVDSNLRVTNRLLELTGPYLQSLDIVLPRYCGQNAWSSSRLGTYEPSLTTALVLTYMHLSSFFLKLS